jgi:hypothetical protein
VKDSTLIDVDTLVKQADGKSLTTSYIINLHDLSDLKIRSEGKMLSSAKVKDTKKLRYMEVAKTNHTGNHKYSYRLKAIQHKDIRNNVLV